MPPIPPSTDSSRRIYARLLGYVRPHWKVFAVAILGMALTAATEPLLPALMKPLLDGSFGQRDNQQLHYVPLFIIGLFVVRGVMVYITHYCLAWVAQRVITDLRTTMFARLVRLPTRYYDNQSSGTLISKVAFDVTGVAQAATSVITVLVRDSLTVVGLLAWLLWLNWKLTLVTLVLIPLVAAVVRAFSSRLRRASRSAQQAMGELTHVLEESIGAHKVVKVFGGQRYEEQRFARANQRLRGFNMRQTVAASATVPLTQVLASIAVAVVVTIALIESADNAISVGGFVSFLTAMLMLLAPLKHLADVNVALQRGLAAAESAFQLMDETAEDDAGALALGRARGALRIESLNFRYPDAPRNALEDISLDIAPGETVALVGASGSGKTTLAHLLPRFYHATSGRILLDGHDLETLTLESLRANLALVSQDVVLFNDTVAANIAYGRMDTASRTQIEAAAQAAHALDFIRAMPQGFDTLVGENGVKLSGGQRQRLAIARAVLKDAPVLILDEATSALDSESERHVQAALEELMHGRTTLVIAHRLSTIERADKIVVMAAGRIAEVGRHTSLLAREGIYANLYRIQYAQEHRADAAEPS